MKIPGPDHPITVTPHEGRVTVTFNGTIVAETLNALVLREASYPPVFYIPRTSARFAHYEKTAHTTHCPYKGDASYFTLEADGARAENAVWSYEAPYPAMAAIKDHVAFYPDKVRIAAS